MTPITLAEYTKKYGNTFLLWVAITFLYTELTSYKSELKEVQGKLYNCLEVKSQISKYKVTFDEEKTYFDKPKKTRYGIKGNHQSFEI